jgi:predicted nucleic acid binding AN1-type Zn finger protein
MVNCTTIRLFYNKVDINQFLQCLLFIYMDINNIIKLRTLKFSNWSPKKVEFTYYNIEVFITGNNQ